MCRPHWTAFILFFVNLFASIVYLIRRNAKADILALVAAEVGVVFCTVNLVTGSIWARPVWGIWWTWDLRLTLTLVLWLIYVSYLMLRKIFQQRADAAVGRCVGDFRRARRSPGLFFHLVFSYSTSPARHRRRRFH